MTVTRRASCSETMTRHPANPETFSSAPASAVGIADCTRCVSCGLATNSTLSAATWEGLATHKRELALSPGVRGKRGATFFETFTGLTGLATNPPLNLAHCGNRGGAPKPVQGRLECAYGARRDRGRFPTYKDSRANGLPGRIVQQGFVPFRNMVRFIALPEQRGYTPLPRPRGPGGFFCV